MKLYSFGLPVIQIIILDGMNWKREPESKASDHSLFKIG